MMFGNSLSSIIISIIVVLMCITVHELAHGYVAYRLGDPTAKSEGRLTLNPLAHLDPIGALLMLVVGFGWAKPVPVNPYYFQGDRQKGMMKVAVAGPAANLILAFIFRVIFSLGNGFQLNLFGLFLLHGITLNVYLAVFNLIPIPPLDGSKILAGFLPADKSYKYLSTLEQYGFLILFVLIIFNITDFVLVPIAEAIINMMQMVTSFL